MRRLGHVGKKSGASMTDFFFFLHLIAFRFSFGWGNPHHQNKTRKWGPKICNFNGRAWQHCNTFPDIYIHTARNLVILGCVAKLLSTTVLAVDFLSRPLRGTLLHCSSQPEESMQSTEDNKQSPEMNSQSRKQDRDSSFDVS